MSKLLYEYKNTTLVQPEVRFGIYPPSKTEKKLVSRYVYEYLVSSNCLIDSDLFKPNPEFQRQINQLKWPELKEFVKEQYWVLVDFFHGQPGGGEREISYTRESGLALQSFEKIASKLGISSSQEVGVDSFFKLKYDVSQELSRLTGESIAISEKTSKKHITRACHQLKI